MLLFQYYFVIVHLLWYVYFVFQCYFFVILCSFSFITVITIIIAMIPMIIFTIISLFCQIYWIDMGILFLLLRPPYHNIIPTLMLPSPSLLSPSSSSSLPPPSPSLSQLFLPFLPFHQICGFHLGIFSLPLSPPYHHLRYGSLIMDVRIGRHCC